MHGIFRPGAGRPPPGAARGQGRLDIVSGATLVRRFKRYLSRVQPRPRSERVPVVTGYQVEDPGRPDAHSGRRS